MKNKLNLAMDDSCDIYYSWNRLQILRMAENPVNNFIFHPRKNSVRTGLIKQKVF
jgi:hypothetical protein